MQGLSLAGKCEAHFQCATASQERCCRVSRKEDSEIPRDGLISEYSADQRFGICIAAAVPLSYFQSSICAPVTWKILMAAPLPTSDSCADQARRTQWGFWRNACVKGQSVLYSPVSAAIAVPSCLHCV
jgi:hypothetical protein